MTRLVCALSVIVAVAMGCDSADPSDLDADRPDGALVDAQAAPDGAVDSGASDGAIDDAGATDAGGSDASQDGGPAVDGGPCGPTLGLPCTDSCPAGFLCGDGRCIPERAGCGGFASAECAQPAVHCCSYPSGSSAGICLTPEESVCLESRSSGAFGVCTLDRR